MKWFKRKPQVEMTEEERRQHELYLQELNKKNIKSAKIVGGIVWCVMMAAWVLLITLDVKHHVGPTKIMFHGFLAAITAVFALPTVIDFFSRKKNEEESFPEKEEEEILEELTASIDENTEA